MLLVSRHLLLNVQMLDGSVRRFPGTRVGSTTEVLRGGPRVPADLSVMDVTSTKEMSVSRLLEKPIRAGMISPSGICCLTAITPS